MSDELPSGHGSETSEPPREGSRFLLGLLIAATTWGLCAGACAVVYSLPPKGDSSIASFYPAFWSAVAIAVVMVGGGMVAARHGKEARNGFLVSQVLAPILLMAFFRYR